MRRAEAAEEVRLKVEREAAEKRRQRLEAGFAQARHGHLTYPSLFLACCKHISNL